MGFGRATVGVLAALTIAATAQAQVPRADSQTWTIRNFKLHDGSVLPEMKVHYLTLGSPANPAVLVLHGTDDAMVPIAHGEQLARVIPHASFERIPGWGHDLPAPLLGGIADRIARHAQSAP